MAHKNPPQPDGVGASLARLRASGAAGPHQPRYTRRKRTRGAQRSAAIRDARA